MGTARNAELKARVANAQKARLENAQKDEELRVANERQGRIESR
jgi:hypothetical protein